MPFEIHDLHPGLRAHCDCGQLAMCILRYVPIGMELEEVPPGGVPELVPSIFPLCEADAYMIERGLLDAAARRRSLQGHQRPLEGP